MWPERLHTALGLIRSSATDITIRNSRHPVLSTPTTVRGEARQDMDEIEIDGAIWTIGPRIGVDQGGMGAVYKASSGDFEAAIKFVPKADGADRELLFADLSGASNIVPIIAHTETEAEYALVMPLADGSLLDRIRTGPVPEQEAVRILIDVATALTSLEDRGVVHRDLKPGNVLLLDGTWCLADFGISRYAESSTAPHTQKFRLTAQYASPEQWRLERATGAADVYAFGVMAFELVAGHLPFPGPRQEDFRDQHIHSVPPRLEVGDALASLVDVCMSKGAGARPKPQQLLTRLRASQREAPSEGLARLQQANRVVDERRNEAERMESLERTAQEVRSELFVSGLRIFGDISSNVREEISSFAPAAAVKLTSDYSWSIHLDSAELTISPPAEVEADWASEAAVPFDVVAAADIEVKGFIRRHDYEGRSHSLWFCDATHEGRFEWYEVAFMASPLVKPNTFQYRMSPYALSPRSAAREALRGGMGSEQLAWPFTPLVPGDLDDFIGRWAGLLAEGVGGPLSRPQHMPERDVGSWRGR